MQLKTALDKVLEEHRELRQLIAGIREFLQKPRPGLGEEGSHAWAACLSQKLVILHSKLVDHFQEEDQTGVLEELEEKFPRVSAEIQTLKRDHGEILRELRRLLDTVMIYSEDRPTERQNLRQRLTGILDKLSEHENRETDLIQSLYFDDIGTKD